MAPFQQRINCLNKESTDELSLMRLKSDSKFGEELNCCFKIDIRNFSNFDSSSQKSQKVSL